MRDPPQLVSTGADSRRVAGMDWDRQRRDQPRREHGSDPMEDSGGPRRPRTPAPKQKVDAEVARLRNEFRSLRTRGDQLAFFTPVKKTLKRLLCDEEAVSKVVRE